MKSKGIRIIASLLVFVMVLGTATFVSFAESNTRTVVDYDFTTMSDLSSVTGIKLATANYTNGKSATWELKDGALVVKSTGGHSLVQIHNFAAFDNSVGFSIEMKVKFIASNGNKTRAGIAYGLDQKLNGTFTFFALKEGNYYSIERNVKGTQQSGVDKGTYMPNNSSTTYEYALNREYTLRVDVNGDNLATAYLDGVKTSAENISFKNDGTGMGIYLRDADLAISSYKIIESLNKDGNELAASNNFINGTKVYEETFDSEDSLDKLEKVYFNTNNGEPSAAVADGRLNITSKHDTVYSLFNDPDTLNIMQDGKAYTIVVKASMNSPCEPSVLTESKTRVGIAFNIKDSSNFDYAVFRANGTFDLNKHRNGAWSSADRAWATSFVDYFANTDYELVVKVASDGTLRIAVDGKLSEAFDDSNDRLGNGIGIVCRNGVASFDSITVYEDSTNNTAYIGCQESAVSGDTFNVRFVAKAESRAADTIGFKIIAEYGTNDSKDLSAEVTTLMSSIIASDAHGFNYKRHAHNLGGSYLFALTVTDIPANIGNITFTVTPYYSIGEQEFSGQSYTVVYNNGAFVTQELISE